MLAEILTLHSASPFSERSSVGTRFAVQGQEPLPRRKMLPSKLQYADHNSQVGFQLSDFS
ncbi:hypothetical protein MY4824_006726 [Beauveria thailandica]